MIAAQNNTIRTNYIKAKIHKIQEKCNCGPSGQSDETERYIKSECSKLASKE